MVCIRIEIEKKTKKRQQQQQKITFYAVNKKIEIEIDTLNQNVYKKIHNNNKEIHTESKK